MRLDFFMLADEAEAQPAPGGGQKLNIRGGGVTNVRAEAFPFNLRALAVVIRFFVEKGDAGSTHLFELRVLDPGGNPRLSLGHEMEISAKLADVQPTEDASLFIVATLANLPLADEGRYVFQLVLDGDLVDSKSIAAILAPEEASVDETRADTTS